MDDLNFLKKKLLNLRFFILYYWYENENLLDVFLSNWSKAFIFFVRITHLYWYLELNSHSAVLTSKLCKAQCPIWHINVTNSLKFTKFLLRWKVDFFSQRGYQGAKHVHYLYFQSSRTRIHEEIMVFLIISRKKSHLAWTGKK